MPLVHGVLKDAHILICSLMYCCFSILTNHTNQYYLLFCSCWLQCTLVGAVIGLIKWCSVLFCSVRANIFVKQLTGQYVLVDSAVCFQNRVDVSFIQIIRCVTEASVEKSHPLVWIWYVRVNWRVRWPQHHLKGFHHHSPNEALRLKRSFWGRRRST